MGHDFSLIFQKIAIFMIAGKVWSLILKFFLFFPKNVVNKKFQDFKDCYFSGLDFQVGGRGSGQQQPQQGVHHVVCTTHLYLFFTRPQN